MTRTRAKMKDIYSEATEAGDADALCRLLLIHSVDVNFKNGHDYTPLCVASDKVYFDSIGQWRRHSLSHQY